MFNRGKVYHRRNDLHAEYGGQEQSGISMPKGKPFIFLFTAEIGKSYGYSDRWEDGVFLFTGEGQKGDMEFVRGNKAIREHTLEGKTLHLFESLGKNQGYPYIGEFSCTSFHYETQKDAEGADRRAIVFQLVPISGEAPEESRDDAAGLTSQSLAELKSMAYESASPAIESRAAKALAIAYSRCRRVRNYVLARANGICESCRQPAPFSTRRNHPYLEAHHTRMASDGGPDHPRWVGAICPNCHCEIHHGVEGASKNVALMEYLGKIEGSKNG